MSNNMESNNNLMVSDNFHLDFPAIMSDGRQFTDFRSSCFMNSPERNMSTFEYREYLKNNAVKIMTNMENIQGYVAECKTCSDYSIVEPSLALTCNSSNCTSNIMNDNGIGLYINYNN
jgi:hypothetical protein